MFAFRDVAKADLSRDQSDGCHCRTEWHGESNVGNQPPNNDPKQTDPVTPPSDPVTPPQPADPQKVTFTAEQQAEINKLIGAARSEGKAKAESDAAAAKAAADAKAEQDRQVAAGEFDKVRQSLESERDTLTTERDVLKGEHQALTGYFTAQYDAALKELPDVITAFKPADDAGFAEKAAWLATAQEQAKKLNGGSPAPKGPGFRPDPSSGKRSLDEMLATAKRSGKYSA